MSESSYIDLVQWTGEQTRADKRGKLRRQEQSTPPAAVWNLSDAPQQWLRQVQGTESSYYRAIGSAEALTRLIHHPVVSRRLQALWLRRFATERTGSVAEATVRIRDRVKRRIRGAWGRRSRPGGE